MFGLKRLLSGFSKPSPGAADLVPEAVRRLLAQKQAYLLTEHVRQLLVADKQAPEVDAIIAEAKRLQWPPFQLDKLRVFADYYRGDIHAAYERAYGYTLAASFDADLCLIAGLCLYYVNDFEAADAMLARAKDAAPSIAARSDFLVTQAIVSMSANRLFEAKAAIDEALRLDPQNEIAAFNALALYLELGDLEAFERIHQDIHAGRYPSAGATYAHALCELALGNYADGFRLLEARYELAEVSRYVNPVLLDKPRWRGESLSDKNLYVTAEQGLGDALMMARYLPGLLKTARHVILECRPEALPLLSFNFPEIEFVTQAHGQLPDNSFDLWLGAMSLPLAFHTQPDTLPATSGYLSVPTENREYWRQRIRAVTSGTRPRIGLAWSGQPNHRADRRRSVAFPLVAKAIADLDADFIALQTTVPKNGPANLKDVSDELITLADTAALVEQLDVVLTVDTSVVHLAGALGKTTWLMLPYRYEWRWGLEGEGNNWYDSVTVIRQPNVADWAAVLDEVFRNRLPEFLEQLKRS